jgi:hypothetical protein
VIVITYKDFINNILETRGRFACGEEYHERHHILPRSCGGTNDKNNLIDLFAKEHFIAHKLLAEENLNNEKLVCAYAAMSFISNEYEKRYRLTPEEYEEARIALSDLRKKKYQNKENHPCYGLHISEERKRKIGEINKGNKYCLGRIITDETRKKIGDANRNPSEETRKKMSDTRKGRGIGASNSNAKSVIRLSDSKRYGCAKDAALENNINYSTFKKHVQKHKNFMYYDEWLKQNNENNNLEK